MRIFHEVKKVRKTENYTYEPLKEYMTTPYIHLDFFVESLFFIHL